MATQNKYALWELRADGVRLICKKNMNWQTCEKYYKNKYGCLRCGDAVKRDPIKEAVKKYREQQNRVKLNEVLGMLVLGPVLLFGGLLFYRQEVIEKNITTMVGWLPGPVWEVMAMGIGGLVTLGGIFFLIVWIIESIKYKKLKWS